MDIFTVFFVEEKKSFLKQVGVTIFHLHLQNLRINLDTWSLYIAEVKVCILLWLLPIL